MAEKRKKREADTYELLQDMLIVQLGLAGVPQLQIREIVGVDTNRVNRIVKYLRKRGAKNDG